MKLTLTNIRKIKKESESKLLKRVCDYVINEWHDYDDKKNIFTDVLHHGCQSGVVGFLIYYSDTVPFYNKHKEEINELLYEVLEETGLSISELFGDKWDEEDPLALHVSNANLLAWFGFEEELRLLGLKFEDLEDYL